MAWSTVRARRPSTYQASPSGRHTTAYSWGAVALPAVDPEVDLNFAMLVHGGQEFTWGEPACSGDVITTAASVKDIHEKGGMGFYVFETVSTNQDGQEVARGTWTNIVRGVS